MTLVTSEHNGGPAGGYALALEHFLQTDYRHAWIIDDDMRPDPECLERLWVVAAKDPPRAFVFPISYQLDGTFGAWPSWCGFLVAREIIEEVGLPMSELFWWAEDTEYCHWRIPQAGYPLRFIEDAVVHHDAIRQGGDLPAWKYYYESRNMLYLHWHIMHRTGRYPRNFVRLIGRAAVRQKQEKFTSLVAIGRGFVDGAFGRLGIRYPIVPLRERSLARGSSDGRSD